MALIDNIKKSEGFVGDEYKDSLGIPTIGYGTRLPISEAEAELILISRLDVFKASLVDKKPIIHVLSDERQDVLFEMAYQLGVGGVLKFKNMWHAIEHHDFYTASLEMLNSKWAKQTPNRAKKLAKIMRGL